MSRLRLSGLILTVVLFSLVFRAPAQAVEDCPQVPDVAWWGDTSPEGLTAYVDRKHDGDWAPYLKKWQKYEASMRKILSRGKSAVVKSQDLVLEGQDLENHIELIARRINATRCIAGVVVEARLTEELGNMETASGGNPEPDFNALGNAECPQYANVVWWETDHAKTVSYVSRNHDGDWNKYIQKWQGQLEKMLSLHERGGVAVFKSKDLRLQGEVLGQYIDALKDRISVTQCLARRQLVNGGEEKGSLFNDG